MLQSALGWLTSFLLGDVLGPGLVVTLLLLAAVICLIRGYRVLAYIIMAAAFIIGSFLAGTQMEKARCEIRIQKLIDEVEEKEEAERQRQEQANEELRRLRDQNYELTQEAARARSEKNEPIIKEIVKVQTVETCSSARWSPAELERLRDSLRTRRERSGDTD